MSERRITVDEVKEAYAKIGAKPKRTEPWLYNGYCCGLAAVNLANGADKFDSSLTAGIPVYGEEYAYGFVRGFDGMPPAPDSAHQRFKDGYEDGRRVASAVFASE